MKSPERLTRHQILLFEGDFAKLDELYTHRSATEVVRILVRKHIIAIEGANNVRRHSEYSMEPGPA